MRDKDQKQNSFEKSEKYVHGLIEIFQCRQAGYRLLRHLQDLLVGLQSGDPELYAQAAREYRHYCEDGHNLYFWGATDRSWRFS